MDTTTPSERLFPKAFRTVAALSAFFFVAFFLASCDAALEESPESDLSVNQFYQSQEDAVAAVNAVYSDLQDPYSYYPRGFYLLADLPTDDATTGQGVGNPGIIALNQYTFTPANGSIDILYQRHYETIQRANSAIANIPEVEMEEGMKARLIGEARFIRGLLYFNLVRFFGGVPLVAEPTTSLDEVNVERASKDAIYAQVVEDFQFAESNLPATFEGENAGRATSMAAKGLLAKVHLTREQWEMAAQKATEVINSGSYGLMDRYRAVFRTAYNEETLFVVSFDSNDDLSGYELRFVLPGNLPGITGWGADVPRPEFYDLFEDSPRTDATFFTSYTPSGGETVEFPPRWYKFVDAEALSSGSPSDADSDYPVLRYADVLLMHAEAVNEMGGGTPEALEHLNMVHRRALGEDPGSASEVDYSGEMSQGEFREAVYRERRFELAKEGHRWFDLVRTGRLVETLADIGLTGVEEYRTVYPIPQREMDTNPNLEQNPGY